MFRSFVYWLIKFMVDAICVLEINGLDNIPKTGNCIAASNHLGRLDAVLVYKIIKRTDIILTVAEKYKKVFVFRLAADALGAIFINRFSVDFRAMRFVLRRLKKGEILVIAPEGTRSINGSLIPGKMGTAFLALKSKSVIIPVALTGTEDRTIINNLKKLKRTKVTVTIGKSFMLPKSKSDNRNEILKDATDEIMCRIACLLPKRYQGVYIDHPRLKELSGECYPSRDVG